MPVEGNIDVLSQAVMSEAQTEADQILSVAREKADAIRKKAQEQAEAQRKEILDKAAVEVDRTRRQLVATAQIQARTIQLENREKLLSKVFEKANQQLPNIEQWSNYDQIARDLLREGLVRLGAKKANVFADKTTLQCLTQSVLDEVSNELNVELQVMEPLQKSTGVIVEAENGRRRYDNTLQTRLSRMRDTLRAPVHHILMGEKL